MTRTRRPSATATATATATAGRPASAGEAPSASPARSVSSSLGAAALQSLLESPEGRLVGQTQRVRVTVPELVEQPFLIGPQVKAVRGQPILVEGVVTQVNRTKSNGASSFFLFWEGRGVLVKITPKSEAQVEVGQHVLFEGEIRPKRPSNARDVAGGQLPVVQVTLKKIVKTKPGSPPDAESIGPDQGVPADREEAIQYWVQRFGNPVHFHQLRVIAPMDPHGNVYCVEDGWELSNTHAGPHGQRVSPTSMQDWQYVRLKLGVPKNQLEDHFGRRLLLPGDQIFDVEGSVTADPKGFFVMAPRLPNRVVRAPKVSPQKSGLLPKAGYLTWGSVNVRNLVVPPQEDLLAPDSEGNKKAKNQLTHLVALARSMRDRLKRKDIIALQEMTSEYGFEALCAAIAKDEGPQYASVQLNPEPGTTGGPKDSDLRCGFLYDPSVVSVEGEPYFIGQGEPCMANSRLPLVVHYTLHGRPVIMIAVHFKSQSQTPPWISPEYTGIAGGYAQNLAQATYVREFAERIAAEHPEAIVAVTGDMNAGDSSETMRQLGAPPFYRLSWCLPPGDRWDQYFRGSAVQLMGAVVTGACGQFKAENILASERGFFPTDHAFQTFQVHFLPPKQGARSD